MNKLGQNHAVTQDDWYEGYFIPKDTIIMLNLWALNYNPEEFPEPEKVSPFYPVTKLTCPSTSPNAFYITNWRLWNTLLSRT